MKLYQYVITIGECDVYTSTTLYIEENQCRRDAGQMSYLLADDAPPHLRDTTRVRVRSCWTSEPLTKV